MKRSSLLCHLSVILSACVLLACSKPPREELRIELRVDGKGTLKDHAADDKVPALENKHLELLDAAIKACAFSSFLSETVRQQGGSSLSTLSSITSERAANQSEVTTSTRTTIRHIELPGQILVCHSGLHSGPQNGQPHDEGCRLSNADGTPQIQYPQVFQSLLQTRHGMQQNAVLTQESIARADKFESSMKSTADVSGDTLSCTKVLVTQ